MADDYIKLPSDTSLTGKKVRTQTLSVGGETVHVHYMILADSIGAPVTSANPLPITAADLPLPSGAATSAKQDDIITAIGASGADPVGLKDDLGDPINALNPLPTKIVDPLGAGVALREVATDISVIPAGGYDAGIDEIQVLRMDGPNLLVDGSSVTQPISGSVDQGTAAANSGKWPTKIINSDDTDNSLSSGGQIGQKVMVVGDNDKYVRGSVAEAGSLSAIEPVFVGVKDSSSNSRGLTGKVLDSRTGMDMQHSSIAAKNIVDFYSSDAAQRLLAGASKVFSPGGTRATYYDLDSYLGFYFSFTDNSPGASGGTLYMRWSRDGTNTPYNDPGDGSGFTNFDAISTAGLVGAYFIPKKNRYVNFVFVQGAADQGATYPQIALMDITVYPMFYTNAVNVTNAQVHVSGTGGDPAAESPLYMGGVDSVSAPTTVLPLLVTSTGEATVQGNRTVFTGTPLVTTEKLATSATTTVTNSFSAATSTQIAASSTSRLGVRIYNGTTQVMYVKFGTAATASSNHGFIAPGTTGDFPTMKYSGVIHAYFVNAVASPEYVSVETI